MKVLFLGAPIEAPTGDLTIRQRFERLGRNTGNLLIGQSLLEELKVSDRAYGANLPAAAVNERFDCVVIGAANFLFWNFDLSHLADYLEPIKLPCYMVGLGAQAPSTGEGVTNIPEGTKRLLSIVSERSKVIGVRGNFTAGVMNDLGFKKVEVTGCPSLYRRRKPRLSIKRPPIGGDINLSLNGSRNVIDHSVSREAARRVETQLWALSIEKGYNYVLQNENPEISISRSESPSEDELVQLNALATRFDIGISGDALGQQVRAKFKVFFDLASWDSYIRGFDASIGSRFHGNLIALTNGVPAFILTHDSRTSEMAEFMCIPHASVEKVERLDVSELLASADYAKFEARYETLYHRYAAFLAKNGLKHRLYDGLSSARKVISRAIRTWRHWGEAR